MGATFNRLKNWIAERLTYSDLNAEIDNILTNLTPSGVDDYSATTTQMRTDTDGGEVGSESLATSLAGELERIRFALREIKGSDVDYWYESAATSLSELASAMGASVLANRIASGRVRTGSSQPLFLVPHGAARTVTLKGATTPFVFYYESVQNTISADVTATSLTAAPSSNNTCLVNMPGVNDEAWTKLAGEYGTTIQVDAMGTEISNLTGKLAGFKLAGGATEYFIARVDSSTQLSQARRGFFFDSSDAPISRTTFADNDTITLMKLTWVYAKSDDTIAVGYTNPTVSADEPTSPATGDYWYDLSAQKWKTYNLSNQWEDTNGILIGVCLQDTSNTVAARGFDFFKNFDDLNTAELERASATQIVSKNVNAELSVYGTALKHYEDRLSWGTSADFDSGVTESASTVYYLYVKESGDRVLSDLAPYDRTMDLKGLYHPYHTWRCLGQVYNNGSSDFVALIDYRDTSPDNYKITSQVGSSAHTLILHANPLSRIRLNANNTTDIATKIQVPSFISLVTPSTATLGHTSNKTAQIYILILSNNGTPYLAVSSSRSGSNGLLTSTAMSTGATSITGLYSVGALTTVPGKLVGSAQGTQTTAGTWATALTAISHPPKAPAMTVQRFTSGTGTYTTPQGVKYLRVKMVGGGGGGGASGASSTMTVGATNPTSSIFGDHTAQPGGTCGQNQQNGAAGGTCTIAAPAITIINAAGGAGGGGGYTGTPSDVQHAGGVGGASFLGGAGGSTGTGNGISAGANTGSGGGGGGAVVGSTFVGPGGGAGGYAEFILPAPDATYNYQVGVGGDGGSAGSNGYHGGAGAAGVIVVEEYYE